jgi:hypothetical protein
MGITRQIFVSCDPRPGTTTPTDGVLSTDNWQLKMTAGVNGTLVTNNAIEVGWGDTIEWLVAPNLNPAALPVDAITQVTAAITPNPVSKTMNAWVWKAPDNSPQSSYILIYNLTIGTAKGQLIFPDLAITVRGPQGIQRPYKAQIWNLYLSFNESNNMVGISNFPDGPFVDPATFRTAVAKGDIVIWQFASPPYSNGGYITGVLPPEYYPLFASIIYTQGICAATIYTDSDKTIDEPYSFSGGALYQDSSAPPFWFTIDPRMVVLPPR